MKERIEELMEKQELSASKFADAIGVQRSSISHILSGRNKPSLELVHKILDRFDQVNADWLLLGKGEMTDESLGDNSQRAENGYAFTTTQRGQEVVTPGSKSNQPKPVKIVIFYSDNSFEEFTPKG